MGTGNGKSRWIKISLKKDFNWNTLWCQTISLWSSFVEKEIVIEHSRKNLESLKFYLFYFILFLFKSIFKKEKKGFIRFRLFNFNCSEINWFLLLYLMVFYANEGTCWEGRKVIRLICFGFVLLNASRWFVEINNNFTMGITLKSNKTYLLTFHSSYQWTSHRSIQWAMF